MNQLPKLKVSPDPRYIGGHPLHQARYIVTEDCELEIDRSCIPEAGIRTESGSIVATMTDYEDQAQLARLFASAPDLQTALRDCLDLLRDPRVQYKICDGGRGNLGEQAQYMKVTRAARAALVKATEKH